MCVLFLSSIIVESYWNNLFFPEKNSMVITCILIQIYKVDLCAHYVEVTYEPHSITYDLLIAELQTAIQTNLVIKWWFSG